MITQKYQVIKPLKEREWEVGDIVQMDAASAHRVASYVVFYDGIDVPKHTAITVDPIKLKVKQIN